MPILNRIGPAITNSQQFFNSSFCTFHFCSALWFVMEPIVMRGHNFTFLRKIMEKIKHTRDALAPEDPDANLVGCLTQSSRFFSLFVAIKFSGPESYQNARCSCGRGGKR